MDVLTPEQRRLNMSRITARHTRPELAIRRALHAVGLRFRLHDKRLPGCPDLVFGRYKVALFVNGCFWHGHACHLFKAPVTRSQFWRKKISDTRERDSVRTAALYQKGWRVLTVWECALKGPKRLALAVVAAGCQRFIKKSNAARLEISGGGPTEG